MTDITVKEKSILEQLAATGLDALHYYDHGISVTLLVGNKADFLDEAQGTVVLARGIAICSMTDQFSKKEGRFISLGRALKAYREQCSSKEVILRGRLGNVGAIIMFDTDHITIRGSTRVYKSCWMPELTEKEQALLKSRTRIKE